jgi:hypothetical protein
LKKGKPIASTLARKSEQKRRKKLEKNIFNRVYVMRHVQRDKKNVNDNQALTILGEITAFIMGIIARKFNPKLVSWGSSPQPRAIRTGMIFLQGLAEPVTISVKTENGLNDTTTDQRDVVQDGLKATKKLAKTHGIPAETAMFICEAGQEALKTKVFEFLKVINQYGKKHGDHLLTVHAPTIDGAYSELRCKIDSNATPGIGGNLGQFDYGEGFIASYDADGGIVSVEAVRQPLWLKTLSIMAKHPS